MQIHDKIQTPLLIVGGGIAGLSCAVEANKQGIPHILISKTQLATGASFFPLKATLGIQVTGENDEPHFAEDINRVAQGMNNPKIVKAYIENSAQAVDLLHKIGFQPWKRNDNRPACFARYPRPIYLINDWKSAVKNAKEIIQQQAHTTLFENATLLQIVSDQKQVQGAIFSVKQDQQIRTIFCQTDRLILATGGIAGLYQDNLYPADVIGSSHFLALQAGANLVNLEFIQFIPAFIAPKYKVLFGEHTLKYCTDVQNQNGQSLFPEMQADEFAQMVAERSAYAPFSIDFDCAKFDLRLMQYLLENPVQQGVYLRYAPELYQDNEEFYRVYLNWLKQDADIDLLKPPIAIAPFAHSCNGGVEIDEWAETAVKGLFAVGEVASCIEGANRLGGNSVGGALVFAKRAIEKIAKDLKVEKQGKNPPHFSSQHFLSQHFPSQIDENPLWKAVQAVKNTENNAKKDPNLTASQVLSELRQAMAKYANVYRTGENLQRLLERLKALEQQFCPLQHQAFHGIEIYNALKTAQLVVQSMQARTESRGSHYRADYPAKDPTAYVLRVTTKGIEKIIA